MDRGFKIATIFGIDIKLDPTWIFIFLLVTWNLSVGIFPSIHPEWTNLFSWTMGAFASLLFFASVLTHELAHSVVAKLHGLPVNQIVLFIFGGVSDLEKEPPTAKSEFLIAIVGPITSFLLGGSLLLLSGTISNVFLNLESINQLNLEALTPLSTVALWLGSINILLGAFNLIPGFPLDGGRVLRSILWSVTRNLEKATFLASRFGQAIAFLFIFAGISMVFGIEIPYFGSGILSGLWLVFIGWFLNNAAEQSYNQVVVQNILEDVPVAKLMHSETPKISPDLPVKNLIYDHIMKTEEHAFPVVNDNQLEGVVCLDDVQKVSRENWDSTEVKKIMIPVQSLDSATPEETASDALKKLEHSQACQIPVIEKGELVGLLGKDDILMWLRLHQQSEDESSENLSKRLPI